MKKAIKILFSILLILSCSYVIARAEIIPTIVDRSRGVNTAITFSGGGLTDLVEGGEYYFDEIANTLAYCFQQTGPFFYEKPTRVTASVKGNNIDGSLTITGTTPTSDTINVDISSRKIKNESELSDLVLTLDPESFSGKSQLNETRLGINASAATKASVNR